MSASVSLHDLSFATPDGQRLFSNIDLAFGPGKTGLIGRNGTGKSTLLSIIAGLIPPASGSVTLQGTVGRLDQIVSVSQGQTVADLLGVAPALALLDRLGQGLGSADDAADADWTLSGRIESALAEVGLPDLEPDRPVDTLSGGQNTRLALARLLLAAPDIVLLDEPTNNLDAEGREDLLRMLQRWRGAAIVVSHDRDLLRQMNSIVELTTLGARSYGGNWDHYRAQKSLELNAAENTLARAERHLVEIDHRAQALAERKARKDGAGSRKAARGGMPRILLGGMKDNAEKTGGEGARLATRQRAEADATAAQARAQVEVLTPLTVKLASTGLPSGKVVLAATELTVGHDTERPIIKDFNLSVTGPERIAITGPNGAGKTTLLKLLTGVLKPSAGQSRIFTRWAYLDQSVSILDPARDIRTNFMALNPGADENTVRAALARFMFRADAALQSVATLSGGETLRAGLAATIGGLHPPELLILDEPTNHLDIYAIEELEAGLRAYDGALLVVSHDQTFLDNIAITKTLNLNYFIQ